MQRNQKMDRNLIGRPSNTGLPCKSCFVMKAMALAIAAIMLAPLPVTAQQGQGSGRGGMMVERFQIIDQNEDGVIVADEAAAWHEAVFFAMDADDDGALTMDEYMAVRMGSGGGNNPERMAARHEQKATRFAPMDGDGDGVVSQAEFMAGGLARFEAADTNDDGKATVWEFRSQHRKF
jgi:hypothetical protein